jgi:hypothetical protein
MAGPGSVQRSSKPSMVTVLAVFLAESLICTLIGEVAAKCPFSGHRGQLMSRNIVDT